MKNDEDNNGSPMLPEGVTAKEGESSRWMTRREVATYLRVSVRTIDRLRLPHFSRGRVTLFYREQVDKFLLERVVEPQVVVPARLDSIRPANNRQKASLRKKTIPLMALMRGSR